MTATEVGIVKELFRDAVGTRPFFVLCDIMEDIETRLADDPAEFTATFAGRELAFSATGGEWLVTLGGRSLQEYLGGGGGRLNTERAISLVRRFQASMAA